MLNTNSAGRNQDQEQQEFGPGEASFHDSSPFKREFSAFLDSLPIKALEYLMTTQQKNLAKALWEAENYGGRPTPGDFKNMKPLKDYQTLVVLIDHQQQWSRQALPKTQKNC
jgi:hypothetical protein